MGSITRLCQEHVIKASRLALEVKIHTHAMQTQIYLSFAYMALASLGVRYIAASPAVAMMLEVEGQAVPTLVCLVVE